MGRLVSDSVWVYCSVRYFTRLSRRMHLGYLEIDSTYAISNRSSKSTRAHPLGDGTQKVAPAEITASELPLGPLAGAKNTSGGIVFDYRTM